VSKGEETVRGCGNREKKRVELREPKTEEEGGTHFVYYVHTYTHSTQYQSSAIKFIHQEKL
jgi:hypothetical protein